MLNENFVLLGAVINIIGSLGYLWATIKGTAKPNRVSFFLWSLAPLIAFAAQLYEGVGIQSLTTFLAGFTSLSIFCASFVNKKAYWKITKFDLACGTLSLIGLLLWAITTKGNLAIFFAIVADGLAAIPTILKAYKYPETEPAFPWIASSTGGLLTLLTVTNWNLANYGFPFYIFIVNLFIFCLVKFRVNKLKLL